jgi:hypothetical protein
MEEELRKQLDIMLSGWGAMQEFVRTASYFMGTHGQTITPIPEAVAAQELWERIAAKKEGK